MSDVTSTLRLSGRPAVEPDTEPGPDSAWADSVPIPDSASRYQFENELGRGGMGAVIKGRDGHLERDIAVKVLLPGSEVPEEAMRRFVAEARIAGRLQHPGIVPIYDLGRLNSGQPYFTMKLVEGQTLRQLLDDRAHAGKDRDRFLHIFLQVCQTVAYAHSRGIVHRDLKPANVMVGAFGEVQVMDWGLAKDVARGENDQVDARSDVFGLGGILCEILLGLPPFPGESDEARQRACRGDLAGIYELLERSAADRELIDLARRCLANNRDDRPPDGQAVVQAVETYRHSVAERLRDAELSSARALERVRAERNRRYLQLALTCLTLLGIGGWGYYQVEQRLRQERGTREVQAALTQALDLRQHAKLAPAREQVQRALALIGSHSISSDLIEQTRKLQDELDTETRTRQVVADLDAARLALAYTSQGGPSGALRRALPLFRQILRTANLVVDSNPSVAVQQIHEFPPGVANQLLGGLDELIYLIEVNKVTEAKADADWLRQVIRAADRDPWRDALRQAGTLADRAARVEALKKLGQSPQLARQPPTACLMLAKRLYRDEEPQLATEVLVQAQRQHPGDFWINHHLGYYLSHQGPTRVGDTIRYYSIAVALRPENSGSHNNLGIAYANNRQYDEAINAFDRALALRPDYVDALASKARTLGQSRRFEEAVVVFQRALAISPDDVSSLHDLAVTYGRMAKIQEAIPLLRRAIALAPENAPSYPLLARCLAQVGQIDEAIEFMQHGSRFKQNDPNLHRDLGAWLTQRGRMGEAADAYREGLHERPKDPDLMMRLAILLCDRLGDPEDAAALFRQVIALQPQRADAPLNLGIAYRRLGDPRAAVFAFRQGEALVGPADSQEFRDRATRLRTDTDRVLAQRGLMPMRQRGNPDVLDRAYDARARGEFFQAVKHFEEALATGPVAFEDRYKAACAALAAAAGRGIGVKDLTDVDRQRLRQQGLAWLQAVLQQFEAATPEDQPRIAYELTNWYKDPWLGRVRERSALERLGPEERTAWERVWRQAGELLDKAKRATEQKR